MKLRCVFFDLDGTLLPMDQDVFVQAYFSGLARKMAPYGYDPKLLMDGVWAGTAAMVKNDGSRTNEQAFMEVCSSILGQRVIDDNEVFMEFYRNEFQQVREVCGFTPQSADVIRGLKDAGLRVVLATNPLFPSAATESRIRWAGLEPEDFELFTTYENSSYCKPNLMYYREILDKIGLAPEECLMVGNDVSEDMVARELGMSVFLLTDCLINRKADNIDQYPKGGFNELMSYIDSRK